MVAAYAALGGVAVAMGTHAARVSAREADLLDNGRRLRGAMADAQRSVAVIAATEGSPTDLVAPVVAFLKTKSALIRSAEKLADRVDVGTGALVFFFFFASLIVNLPS